MPVRRPPKFTGRDTKHFEIIVDQFKGGTKTLLDESRIGNDSVYQSINMMLDQDGVWRVRYGSNSYGAPLTQPPDSIGRGVIYNTDGTNTNYLFALDNGTLKFSKDGGAWTTVAGKTWASGKIAQLEQIDNRLYVVNATDTLAYLDLNTMTTTPTIITYTSLTTPNAPTITLTTLTTGSYQAYYKITAVSKNIGETAASTEVTTSVNKVRGTWKTDNTEHIDLTITRVTGANAYNIYYSPQPGQEVFIDSIQDPGTGTTFVYNDFGNTIANPYQAWPPTDGTAGPKINVIKKSGNRIWGTGDPSTPYRIYWTGVGQYMGSFNPFYGGGYIDLNLGSDEKPIDIEHYRSGKGDAVLTAITSSPPGGGSVWFIPLTSITASALTIVIPAPTSQGTIGTTSMRGVVSAQNNLYYPSIKGFQSLGSTQGILNVLVTSEISTGIRPSVKGISNLYANQICGIYYYGRIFFGVPSGSSTNNQIWVLDLERQAWCVYWTLGVKQFLEYTDSAGTPHLLAVPVTGNTLIELSDGFSGDSGLPFSVNLQSGLIPWNSNHFQFAWIQKVYVELGRPKGNIDFTVSGTGPNKTLALLKNISFASTVSNAGLGSDLVGNFRVGDSNNAPTTFSQSSQKKVLYINKALNNIRWQLTSNDVNASFTLLEVGIIGNILPQGDPSSWRK